MLRNIGFVVLALLVFMLVVMAGDAISMKLAPPMPEGLQPHDHEAMARYAATIPAQSFLVMVLAHLLGALAAGWVVGRFLGHGRVVWIMGVLLTSVGIWNILALPHPAWFWVDALVYLPGALIGFFMGRVPRSV